MNIPQETRLIHCYDLISFVAEIEKAVKDGFSLDFKDNTRCPVQIGFQLICTMVKEEPEEVKPKIELFTKEVTNGVDIPVESLKTISVAPESTQEGGSTTEGTKEVVEASKRGRKAKG